MSQENKKQTNIKKEMAEYVYNWLMDIFQRHGDDDFIEDLKIDYEQGRVPKAFYDRLYRPEFDSILQDDNDTYDDVYDDIGCFKNMIDVIKEGDETEDTESRKS